MADWLYILRPLREGMLSDGPTDTESAVLLAHLEHMQRIMEDGSLVLAGRTQYADMRTMGIVIIRAQDEEAARALMESDPPVAAGVMSAELHPYAVAFMGSGS